MGLWPFSRVLMDDDGALAIRHLLMDDEGSVMG